MISTTNHFFFMFNPWQVSRKQSFDESFCVLSTYLILKHLELTLDKTFSTAVYSHSELDNVKGCHLNCRTFSSKSGFYSLAACRILLIPICDHQKYLQAGPNVRHDIR